VKLKMLNKVDECEGEPEEELEGTPGDGPDNWTPTTLVGFGPGTRTVLVGGTIEPVMGSAICSQVERLAAESDDFIKVVINSPGGDIIQVMAIYDMLRAVTCPIITLTQGMAFSGGFVLAQAGDLRLSFPNSRFFYHEPIGVNENNSLTEAAVSLQSYAWSLETMNEVIRKRTKISKTNWNKHFAGKTSVYFSAQEAKDLKIIDEIIEYPKKPKLNLRVE